MAGMRARLMPSAQKELVKKYQRGQTIRDLAAAYDFSYTGMHALLLRNGCKFRAKGSFKKKASTKSRVKANV
jgi:hypothetical protein